MREASKGASHISRYYILLMQVSLHITILYPESTYGTFDILINNKNLNMNNKIEDI